MKKPGIVKDKNIAANARVCVNVSICVCRQKRNVCFPSDAGRLPDYV